MLKTLHIQNIALIRELELDFSRGFQVLTGETGAGKSILIDSIGLLTGTRADRGMIRTGETTASVAGLFGDLSERALSALRQMDVTPDPDGNILIQRSFSIDGKGKCKVNGEIVTLSALRDIAKYLIDIHGQSDTMALYDADTYIRILDAFAGISEELSAYGEAYSTYDAYRREMDEILRGEAERARNIEMLTFQIADIDAVSPKVGEDEELAEREARIKNRERVYRQSQFVWRALKGAERGNVAMLLDRSIAAVESLVDALPSLENAVTELRDCQYRLDDIAEQMYDLSSEDEGDPAHIINETEERLSALSRLKKKYGSTIEEILAYREAAAKRLEKLQNSDGRLLELKDLLRDATEQATLLAKKLHDKRTLAAEMLSSRVIETLVFLDMPKVSFLVNTQEMKNEAGEYILAPTGYDRVDFLISANSGENMQSLSMVASGGELARMMLALKSVENGLDESTTMVFDEIDTGVSGKTARKIGLKLLGLSEHTQIFCVTHSAQIASLANDHLLITKEEHDGRTETSVTALDEEGRIRELSRILGGIHVTEAQKQAAIDMRRERREL